MSKIISCTVLWFDENSGEGQVRAVSGGPSAFIYACNIKGRRTWCAETACVKYKRGQVVDVYQDENGFVIGVTHGAFQQDKWNQLNSSSRKLAFVVDPETDELVSGLFA